MSSHRLFAALCAATVSFGASVAAAQCERDIDCKADRVCEAGRCVAPSNSQAPHGELAQSTRAQSTRAPVAPAVPKPPAMRRHSTGMMVGGIVMVSLAPVALLVAGVTALGKSVCNIDNDYAERDCNDANPVIYGSLLSALGLVGAGIPLMVIGATKEPVEPVPVASLRPWATREAAGLALQLHL